LAVHQYTPKDNPSPQPGDITVIASHGVGCAKELYEPLFDEIFLNSKQGDGGLRIRSIWIADIASHGGSSVLNEGKLGVDSTSTRQRLSWMMI